MSWIVNEYKDFTEVLPVGEEVLHISGTGCNCWPVVKSTKTKPMVVHNSFDGREVFEQAEAELPGHYRQRRAA